jgi:hypothetical protein
VQGRLRRQPLTVRIDSECRHCGELLQIVVTDDFDWHVTSRTATPLLFMPDVNWATFRRSNIIHDY